MDSEVELVQPLAKPQAKPKAKPKSNAQTRPAASEQSDDELLVSPVGTSGSTAPRKKALTGTARKSTGGPRSAPATTVTAKVNGKGKAKAEPPPPTNDKQATIDLEDHSDDNKAPSPANAKSNTKQTRTRNDISGSSSRTKRDPESQKEIDRLMRLYASSQRDSEKKDKIIEDLKKQLEEIIRIRNTEPEALKDQVEESYKTQLAEQTQLHDSLRYRLGLSESLLRSGKTNVMSLIPQEIADAHSKLAERKATEAEKKCKEFEQMVKDRDTQLADAKQSEKFLQAELKAEQDRSKQLASSSKGKPGNLQVGQVAKHVETIKFYEEVTNLLVTNLRITPANDETDVEIQTFVCMYSCDERSLNFTVAFRTDSNVVNYEPANLDKESQEFRTRLDYLSEGFTFEKGQLSLFFSSLHKYMKNDDDDTGHNSIPDGDEDEGGVSGGVGAGAEMIVVDD